MNIPRDELALLELARTGVFRVDPSGSVWQCRTQSRVGRWRDIPPRRVDRIGSDRYRRVRIEIGGRTMAAMAHRLVWLALVGPIPDGMEINHKDGHRGNNNPSNLEPLTPGANQEHAYRELARVRMSGEKNGRAVLNERDVATVRARLAGGESHRSIAKTFGVTHRVIGKIARGEAWRT